jgi:outer membrane protein assembly factor BamB
MGQLHRRKPLARLTTFGLLPLLWAACKGDPAPGEGMPSGRGGALSAGIQVLTNRYDNLRSGANTRETVLNPGNVNGSAFGLLFSRPIDGNAYAQPLYVSDLEVGGRKRNVVFVATSTNHLYAFDADDPAASMPLWSRWLAPIGEVQIGGRNPNSLPGQTWCRDTFPFVGITGTPVIDETTGLLYVVTKQGRVGEAYTNKLHAIDIRTGQDAPGSPVSLEASMPGTGGGTQNGEIAMDGWKHVNRAGLLLHEGTLYVTMGSHCDDNPYHGWMLAYDPATLRRKSVFNTTPDGQMGAIWQSGIGPAANANGIFFSVGNGTWSADGRSLGASVVRMNPDNTVADWFTPSNADQLNRVDADLAAILLAPNANVAFAGGKEGVLYVIDQMNMTHFNADGDKILQRFPVADPGPTMSAHIHTIAFWNDRIYLWPENHGLRVYAFANNRVEETPVARLDDLKTAHPGGIFTISANGNTPGSGILWTALITAGDAWGAIATGMLVAVDATTGARLWDSTTNPADALGNFAKWSPPTVANGKVYVASFARVNASSPAFLRVYGLRR